MQDKAQRRFASLLATSNNRVTESMYALRNGTLRKMDDGKILFLFIAIGSLRSVYQPPILAFTRKP